MRKLPMLTTSVELSNGIHEIKKGGHTFVV